MGNYNFHLNYSYVLKHHEFYQTYLLYQKPPENKSVWPTKSHEIDLVLLPTWKTEHVGADRPYVLAGAESGVRCKGPPSSEVLKMAQFS